MYVASDAVWFKRVADPEWQAVPGTPELWGPGMGGKQSILIDDSGFLYVGTGHHSVLRSRVPVGSASTTDSGHGLTIAAWQPGTTPFLQQATFALELGDPAPISLVLYDVRGRVVSRLWEEDPLGAGRHVATWRPDAGVASGSLLAWRSAAAEGYAATEVLAPDASPETAAANLFAALRRLDAAGLDLILAEPCDEAGLGHAIMDRLRRAEAPPTAGPARRGRRR